MGSIARSSGDAERPYRIRTATPQDAEAAARLRVAGSGREWDESVELFVGEFELCVQRPDRRVYYLALVSEQVIAYAGARYYDQSLDENMYGTLERLPSGWYLRGIRVHPDWRRKGLARELTCIRLEWLLERSKQIHVFLDDEDKETIPMYAALGFEEVSRGWRFEDKMSKSTLGILLRRN